MNRRSFLAAAVAALTGATVAKSALLPLTLPDTPIELAKQAGIPVPPAAVAEAVRQSISTTYGIHSAMLDDSVVRIHSAIVEKFAREMAKRIDEEFWISATACQKTQFKLAYHCKNFTGFPVRRFPLDDQKTPR
jgi:hypothetical protein